MSSEQTSLPESAKPPERNHLSQRLAGAGWGVIFIWVAIALLTNVGWGWFLLGIGTVMLAGTVARWYLDLNVSAFGVACGVAFLACGLWELFKLPGPLTPILLILFGVAMLLRAIAGKHLSKKSLTH